MSTSVIERPAVLSFSKNEIRYVLSTNNLALPKLYVQVELFVKAAATGNIYKLVKSYNLKPNADGITYVYITEWINSMLKYTVPATNTAFTNAASQAANFYIRFREVSLTNQNPVWVTTEDQKERVSIKGGIDKTMFSRNNYFNYQVANKLFYTWQPSKRYVFLNEPAFLSLYANLTGTKLEIVVTKGDGSTATVVQNIAAAGSSFWHINVSPSSLNIAGIAGAQPWKYSVRILTAANAELFASYEFFIEHRPIYKYYDLGYHNSLGGFDTIRVRGEVSDSVEREITEAEGGYDLTNWTANIKTPELSHAAINIRRTFKGDIGFIRTADGKMKSAQDALIEITVSPSIFMVFQNSWLPISNIQKGVEMGGSNDNKFGFPVEWQLPFINEVYTPLNIPLQKGTDTEIY